MDIHDIYGSLPVLETDRLILRKINLKDAKDMYAYCSNPEVAKYVTWQAHQTVTATREFIKYIMDQYELKKIAPWGMEWKENGQLIGTIDFVWWQTKNRAAEIGYVLHQDYWGKGIMTEACRKLVFFGFTQMDLIRIQARCVKENKASEKVMQKAGMKYEGTIRKGILLKGKHQDMQLYSILKEEFSTKP
ncbi:GNAT family N-acetyltransferase [Niallia nealsonii]|uniref:GNAT family N-acetyltransferase n=1 Tax=Niallia nealsonii TaxID=115979 RepID=A0A2N0YZV2_9BACI|nr:GNAT family protein [Niallia nealsonii]PKG22774.1 GNAT family N-acetyltransferase [Niallia nealsonii]